MHTIEYTCPHAMHDMCVCVCGLVQVYEVMGDDGKCVRCEDVEGVRDFVKAAQQHAMLLYHLKE